MRPEYQELIDLAHRKVMTRPMQEFGYVNPDGPQLARAISDLVLQLKEAAALINHLVKSIKDGDNHA